MTIRPSCGDKDGQSVRIQDAPQRKNPGTSNFDPFNKQQKQHMFEDFSLQDCSREEHTNLNVFQGHSAPPKSDPQRESYDALVD
jgi:hypothetical protein